MEKMPKIAIKGFTLVEILVAISVIGLLSAIVLVSVNSARAKSRDAKRKAEISQIQKALEMYYNDNGQYPLSGGAASPNSGWSNSNDASWATLSTALASYIKLPVDPVNSPAGWAGSAGTYTYTFYSRNYGCAQQWYMLVYRLENPNITSPGMRACNGTNFNYGGTITVGACARCN